MRILLVLLFGILISVSPICAADHAVILLYHHVSTVTPESTSVSPKVFRQHLQYLDENDFNVLPLGQILRTLGEGGSLPDRTVSITFDDAYSSVMDQAMPLLRERKWPFTVFVNTKAIDNKYSGYMSWGNLKELLTAGAEIGNHSQSHAHLVRRVEGESGQQWRTRISRDIESAQKRLEQELDVDTDLFAYPYGEHTPELQQLIEEMKFFGITQQSGAVGIGLNRLVIPRFPMATNYADMDRFAVSVNTRPLPVTDVMSGSAILIQGSTSQFNLEFTLIKGDYRKSDLACYSSSGEKLNVVLKESADRDRVIIQLPDWKAGRRKINCTAPSLKKNGIYFWYSHLWLVKRPDGTWYKE